MSIENAKSFYQRMSVDREFSSQYKSAANDEERQQIAVGNGYIFSSEEWDAAVAEISKLSNDELREEELTAVSGGMKIIPGVTPPELKPWTPAPKFPFPVLYAK